MAHRSQKINYVTLRPVAQRLRHYNRALRRTLQRVLTLDGARIGRCGDLEAVTAHVGVDSLSSRTIDAATEVGLEDEGAMSNFGSFGLLDVKSLVLTMHFRCTKIFSYFLLF